MYAGRIASCPLVTYDVYADGTDRRTDGRTPEHYVTLRRRQHNLSFAKLKNLNKRKDGGTSKVEW